MESPTAEKYLSLQKIPLILTSVLTKNEIEYIILLKIAGRQTSRSGKGAYIMNKKVIVTISREYGSGGKVIGRKVAEKLGIAFYDRKIIEMTAEKSGLAISFIENTEQKIKNKFLHNLAFGGYCAGADITASQLSLPDKLFIATCDIIRHIADEGSCVIVGRCADYVLKDRKDVIDIFVYADKEYKCKRAIEEYGIAPDNVESEVVKADKYRANHYNYYTERTWGDKSNYHLCLNSGFLGIDKTVDVIVDAVNEYLKD